MRVPEAVWRLSELLRLRYFTYFNGIVMPPVCLLRET